MKFGIIAGITLSLLSTTAIARDQIRIVGSSTVFPFTQAVAEQFSNLTGYPAPVVESTGTGGGMKIFCSGVGEDFVDITGASRAIKESEYNSCVESGVRSVTEVLIGYDGIVLARSRTAEPMNVTRAQLFQAMAAEVEVDGAIVANPYQKWVEIDPELPDVDITIFGPPPTSGTRDAWVELVMEKGCEEFPMIASLDPDQKEQVCSRTRTDGPFIEAGENDNLIVQRLQADENSFGIFGYSFLYENQDTLEGESIEGVVPSVETITDSSYSISRPLFFYVKNDHRDVILGLEDFVLEYVSEDAIGDDGYLTDRGLIPLSPEKREEVRNSVVNSETNVK